MKITKIEQVRTYYKECKLHVFSINGKKIRAYSYAIDDIEAEDYDADIEIDVKDIDTLTEEEFEAIGENLSELADLKVNENINI